jgi:hypothetical protein
LEGLSERFRLTPTRLGRSFSRPCGLSPNASVNLWQLVEESRILVHQLPEFRHRCLKP